jgi:hypothetical protein
MDFFNNDVRNIYTYNVIYRARIACALASDGVDNSARQGVYTNSHVGLLMC